MSSNVLTPPQVNTLEGTDSSLAVTQDEAIHDPLLIHDPHESAAIQATTNTHTVVTVTKNVDSHEPYVHDAIKTNIPGTPHTLATQKINTPDPLSPSPSSEVVPAVTLSGDVSPNKPQSRSRSPSPKPNLSSPKRWLGGRVSPIAAVKSIVTAAKSSHAQQEVKHDLKQEKQGIASSGSSLEPSPITSPRKTANVIASEEVISNPSKKTTSPSIERKVDTTTTSPTTTEAVGTSVSQSVDTVQTTSNRSGVNPVSLSLPLASGKDSKPTKLTTGARKMIKKPGIEQESLVSFFNGKIAHEENEVLLNILWCGSSLTSTPGCEVESGLFVSDKGIYLLQVMDSEKDRTLSWQTENAPLLCSFHAYHLTLSQIKIGIFDQSVTFECVEKGAFRKLVIFPRTGENMLKLLDNLKAALDASRIPYHATSIRESLISDNDDSSNVLFVNPDVTDLQKLKESLVKSKVMAHLSSHMMGYSETTSSLSFVEEIRKASEDAAAKFEILQYVVVSEINTDLLPVSNGTIHFRPYVLILTNNALYLCKDEIASWPTDPNSPVAPPFSRCRVLDSYSIDSVTGIEMCDRAQAIVQISDPIYEFRISFCVNSTQLSKGTHKWQLCVYDRQYIDQFFSCLQLLWHDIHHTTLTITYTADPLAHVPLTPATPTKRKRSHSLSERQDITAYTPTFYKSKALVDLASLTSSDRLKFFKERVSEAQFMKSDEVPMAVFMGFCSTEKQDPTQVEACIIASQYAIYLVSDVENIHQWLDGGGASSFSRMSLLNKQCADEARCFFRLWINEISEVQMGFFYLSILLKTSNSEHNFCIHSQDTSSMLTLLSAFSCSTNLRNTVEQQIFDELLSDYIDLGGDSLSGKAKQAQKNVKTNIEFQQSSDASLEILKQILLCISPSIEMSTSVEQSTSGLQIILGQVMMMIEELNIRGTHTVKYQLHLVMLSNYGLFVCANSASETATPAVLQPTDLKVKRWCHIDLIDYVQIVSNPQLQQCNGHVFSIHLQSQKGTDGYTLVLVAQNSEQLKHFLYQLSLLWYERNEKSLPIYTIQ